MNVLDGVQISDQGVAPHRPTLTLVFGRPQKDVRTLLGLVEVETIEKRAQTGCHPRDALGWVRRNGAGAPNQRLSSLLGVP